MFAKNGAQKIFKEYGLAEEYIKSHAFNYWQKYVNGVNMSFIDCEYQSVDKRLPKLDNKFTLMISDDDFQYYEVESQGYSYAASLVAPILIELAKRVNYSLHLFVDTCDMDESRHFSLVIDGQITSINRVPQKYSFETNLGFNCSKPLYISNQMVIMAPINSQANFPIQDIFNTFDTLTWYLILASFLMIMATSKLSCALHKIKNSLLTLMWIYSKPMIGINEPKIRENHKWVYILWVISMFPLTTIVNNEFLAKLLLKNTKTVNTIEDLLNDKISVYTRRVEWQDFTDIKFTQTIQDTLFNKTFSKVVNKMKVFEDIGNVMQFVDLFTKPKELFKFIKNIAVVENEDYVKVVTPLLSRVVPINIGNSYIPQLITPLCYGQSFAQEFASKVEIFSKRLFEVSLIQRWYHNRYDYTVSRGLIALNNNSLLENRLVSEYYSNTTHYEDLHLYQTTRLFQFMLFSSLITLLVFIIEYFLKFRDNVRPDPQLSLNKYRMREQRELTKYYILNPSSGYLQIKCQ